MALVLSRLRARSGLAKSLPVLAAAILTGGAAQAQSTPWQAQKVESADGSSLCLLARSGTDPHPFSVAITGSAKHVLIGLDDPSEGVSVSRDLIVTADGRPVGRFAVVVPLRTKPQLISSLNNKASSAAVVSLVDQIRTAHTVWFTANNLVYLMDLSGFASAAQEWNACRKSFDGGVSMLE